MRGLKTTSDLEEAADPVVKVIREIEEAKELTRVLWAGFLGQWGPPSGVSGRHQHRWRVHTIIGLLEIVGQSFEDGEAALEWTLFCASLPGFTEYFSCGCPWEVHGGP